MDNTLDVTDNKKVVILCGTCNISIAEYVEVVKFKEKYYCKPCLVDKSIITCDGCDKLVYTKFIENGKCNICRYSKTIDLCKVCNKHAIVLKTNICIECIENIAKSHFPQYDDLDDHDICNICDKWFYYKYINHDYDTDDCIGICDWCYPEAINYEHIS